MGNRDKIIIALDGISKKEALRTARILKGHVWGFKINDLLFEDGKIIGKLKEFGKVFADAKLYDIPNTVAHSVAKLSKAGADLITVHASGGVGMMKAAKSVAQYGKILGVTLLTSRSAINKKEFLKLVQDIKKAELDGVVCSAHELKYLRNTQLLKVVPGIRPKWYVKKDDQSRTATPREAINLGTDFIVIGRPILNSSDPRNAVLRILSELK